MIFIEKQNRYSMCCQFDFMLICRTLNHPNLVRYLGLYDTGTVYIVKIISVHVTDIFDRLWNFCLLGL
jgi:hypothetical protein